MRFSFILLIVFPGIFGCEKGPGIPLETYAAFRSEWLLIEEQYPDSSLKQKDLLEKTMRYFDLDTVRLNRFYSYYQDHPQEWLTVETTVEKRLKDLLNRRQENGRGKHADADRRKL